MVKRFFLFVLFGFLLLSSCDKESTEDEVEIDDPVSSDMYFPGNNSETWEEVSTSKLNWCEDELSSLNTYLEEKNTKAFIALVNGRIAIEWYFGSFEQDSAWYWASAGKTITALLVGLAQQDGSLSIEDKTSNYLGNGWTSLSLEKEELITIKDQLTMTTGLDDRVLPSPDCTDKSCLQYASDAGTRWAYHNAPYTLLGNVLEAATGVSRQSYTTQKLGAIGLRGIWIKLDFNEVFFSNARSMARFGLLILNRGIWNDNRVINEGYFNKMTNSSQDLNPSYGYLWWLNGKKKHMLPQTQVAFQTDLIPSAPDDLIAALGKNDQKIYVVPSKKIVVIRIGDSAEQPRFALSSFDNELWEKMEDLECH